MTVKEFCRALERPGHGIDFTTLLDEAADEPAAIIGPSALFDRDLRLAQQIQDPAIETVDEQTRKVDEKKEKKKEWYDRINIRGYTRLRINSVLWSDEDLAPPCLPGDRSVAPLNHFFIRRCRLILSGDPERGCVENSLRLGGHAVELQSHPT